MLDFKFYIPEEEYKNAERHIMYLISNSIKDLGLMPVYERDTKPQDVREPQMRQSVPKVSSNKP